LSLHNGIGARFIPSSLRSEWIQTNCLLVSHSNMYSALVEESAIDFCALEFQQNTPFAIFTKSPVVDFLVTGSEAQSESVYAIIPPSPLPLKIKA